MTNQDALEHRVYEEEVETGLMILKENYYA